MDHPEKGLLGYEMGLPTIVQYWRSFDQLEAFAKDGDDPHLDAWRKYWKRVGKSQRTGIWHETYLVRAGEYEAVYGNIPAFGLGAASKVVPVAESSTARRRLRAAAGSLTGLSEADPPRQLNPGPPSTTAEDSRLVSVGLALPASRYRAVDPGNNGSPLSRGGWFGVGKVRTARVTLGSFQRDQRFASGLILRYGHTPNLGGFLARILHRAA